MAFKKLKLWYDQDMLTSLGDKISRIDHSFNKNEFIKETLSLIEPLELKDRVKVIGEQIYQKTSGDYPAKVKVLTKILGPENPDSLGTFNNYFWVWPIASVAEHYGLEHWDLSIQFIKEITKRSTGEFAIRPYLEFDPKKIIKLMQRWSTDQNFHVRRMSSEGIRPILPWARKFDFFKNDPDPVFSILNNLKNDSIKYVQKSVANHLNDYLKLNFEYTINKIEEWSKSTSEDTRWIIFHAIKNERKKKSEWSYSIMKKIGR